MIFFVVPVYRSAESLPELHQRLIAEFDAAPGGFKLIFVEDCGVLIIRLSISRKGVFGMALTDRG